MVKSYKIIALFILYYRDIIGRAKFYIKSASSREVKVEGLWLSLAKPELQKKPETSNFRWAAGLVLVRFFKF